MRRILVLTVALSMIAGSAAASEWHLGLQGGLNNSGVSGDAPSGVSYGKRAGPIVGLVGEFRIADDVWLSLQPMYVQRGTSTLLAIKGQQEKLEGPSVVLDYFAVPILARILSDSGRTYIAGGLNPSFLLTAEQQENGTSEDISGALNGFDLAADISFGLMFPIRRSTLNFEIRYEQSVSNLAASDREDGDDTLPVRFRSSGFQFMAGLMWPLGGR
jgi:hypothetical protein